MAAAEDRRSTTDALLGRTIAGKYTIESRVGGGGMGSVYRARQAGLDKVVAVKVLHRELLAEPTFASRFKREATSASRIDHPCSLRVLDFGEEPDGVLFIAMEFLEGRTLYKVIREEAPLAPARIVDLSRQILAALAAAHDLGIVHRDLKPENVVILPGKDDDGRPTEHVKVCDFGIAKLQKSGAEVDEKLTLEGSIVGTPEYLSPEQARGGELDARSDLYSMGVILFEMLTGEPPFRGDTPLSIVLKHLDAPPPIPSMLTPRADPKLEAVCLKALSKAPSDRFASAREMRAAMATDTPEAAAPPAPLRTSGVLMMPMTETPPPVSSTQAPLPLMSKRSSALSASGSRPRLSQISEPPRSGGGGVMVTVVALALVGGGAGAYWLRRHAPLPDARSIAAAGPIMAPSATLPEGPGAPSEVPRPPATGEATTPKVEPAMPPSEVGSAAPKNGHRRGRAATPGVATKDVPGGEPATSDVAAPLPEDLGGRPSVAPPSAGAASVRVAHVDAVGVAAGTVTGALPMGRLARCFHGAAGSHASVKVHLELRRSRTKSESQINDTALAPLASCINDATSDMIVQGIPAEGASADVDLSFDTP